MKQCYLLILLLIPVINAYPQATESQQIENVLNTQKDAWNRGDMEGYMDGYWQSDSLVFVGSNGITKGWQQTLERYKKSYPDKKTMGRLNFVFEQIDIIGGDEAFVLGRWSLKRVKGDLGGFFTLRLRKITGAWKIILDHSS